MSKRTYIIISFTALIIIVFSFGACSESGNTNSGPVKFKNEMDKVSYSIGTQIGSDFKRMNIDDLNTDLIARAIEDVINDRELALTDEEMQTIMTTFSTEMQEKMQAEQARMMQENAVTASEFLEENAQKEGVITLPDSLQYEVITEGTGASPGADDTVKVHYTGTLLDGTVFDSSVERGEPAQFQVGGVIPGWTEALQMMKVGGKWKLYIPPQLAYGPRGMGDRIEPNSLLIFEVELLDIVEEE